MITWDDGIEILIFDENWREFVDFYLYDSLF